MGSIAKDLNAILARKHLFGAAASTAFVQVTAGGDVMKNLIVYGGTTLLACSLNDLFSDSYMQGTTMTDMLIQGAAAGLAGSAFLALGDFIPGGLGGAEMFMAAAIIGGGCVVGDLIAKDVFPGKPGK